MSCRTRVHGVVSGGEQISCEGSRDVLVHGGGCVAIYTWRALPVCGRIELALARGAHPEDHTLVSE